MRAANALVAIGVCVLALIGCQSTPEDATPVSAIESYESWTKVNDQTLTGDETGTLGRRIHGGETGFREVFANSVGAPVAAGEASLPYPEGSVLVKETYQAADGEKGELADVTVMVKREAGYDEINGDWEWIVLNDSLEVQNQGRIDMCANCHAAAADIDFAFTTGM